MLIVKLRNEEDPLVSRDETNMPMTQRGILFGLGSNLFSLALACSVPTVRTPD